MNKLVLSVTAIAMTIGSMNMVAAQETPAKKPKRLTTFEKIDTNKDGKISKAESASYNEKRFNRIDANNDGVVSREEMKANRSKKRTRRAARTAKTKPAVKN